MDGDDDAVVQIAALAEAGARVLVGAMASLRWAQVRSRVARLIAHDDPGQTHVMTALLDASRRELEASGADREKVGHSLEHQWRGSLRQLLTIDPAAAAGLREIVREFGEDPPTG